VIASYIRERPSPTKKPTILGYADRRNFYKVEKWTKGRLVPSPNYASPENRSARATRGGLRPAINFYILTQ